MTNYTKKYDRNKKGWKMHNQLGGEKRELSGRTIRIHNPQPPYTHTWTQPLFHVHMETIVSPLLPHSLTHSHQHTHKHTRTKNMDSLLNTTTFKFHKENDWPC